MTTPPTAQSVQSAQSAPPTLAQQLPFTGPLEGALGHVQRFADPKAGRPTLLLTTAADLGQPVTIHVTRSATDDLEVTGSHHGQPAHLGFFTVPGLRARWQAELDAAAQARRQEDLLRQPWTFIQPLTR